jgi:hypothetical protein
VRLAHKFVTDHGNVEFLGHSARKLLSSTNNVKRGGEFARRDKQNRAGEYY